MTQTNTQNIARHSLLVALLCLLIPVSSHAASSWNPTYLINTEAFQTIDEGDSNVDVELRFGGTLDERLYFDRSEGHFQFTDDLHVEGNLSSNGTLSIEGATSLQGTFTVTAGNTVGLNWRRTHTGRRCPNALPLFDVPTKQANAGTALGD